MVSREDDEGSGQETEIWGLSQQRWLPQGQKGCQARGSDLATFRHHPGAGAVEKEPKKEQKVGSLWCELREEGSGKQARK